MANEPSLDEIARWDRWFAVEMNNRGWELAEQAERTPEETEEMLHAAHAAAMHWARVGTDLNEPGQICFSARHMRFPETLLWRCFTPGEAANT